MLGKTCIETKLIVIPSIKQTVDANIIQLILTKSNSDIPN